jgi:hypothetical protein
MEMTVVGEGTMSGVACAMTCCVLIVDGEECNSHVFTVKNEF